MTNLLKETKDFLGNRVEGIQYIGSQDGFSIPLDEWEKIFDVDYDSGYGAQEIATDLIIIGSDWYCTRFEYDGSESWQLHTMPDIPVKTVEAKHVKVHNSQVGWETLSTIHDRYFREGNL